MNAWKQLSKFHKTRFRSNNRTGFKFLIGSSPFNAKRNPFYSGAFNGNDCFQLMQNHVLIFEMLRKAAADEENDSVKEEVNKIADGVSVVPALTEPT
jgi:hypothetical protein